MNNARRFRDTYAPDCSVIKIAEIGSQNVNGSLREIFPDAASYVGLDFCEGNGVDIILTDPYRLPFPDGSFDIVLSSSVFEHSEFFWLLFCEAMRVLKPDGLFYMNAPSNGSFHRFPVDCWRFFPDSGKALAKWASLNGQATCLLESYVAEQEAKPGQSSWNDFVGIFLKGSSPEKYPNRIIDSLDAHLYRNAQRHDNDAIENMMAVTQDIAIQRSLWKELTQLRKQVAEQQALLDELRWKKNWQK